MNNDDLTLEQRVKRLELLVSSQEMTLSVMVSGVASMVKKMEKLNDDVQAFIEDCEVDGKATIQRLESLRGFLARQGKFLYALDAKNTALATVVCRQLNIDPDVMLMEYNRVLEDFGAVENLIDSTKADPESD